MILPISIVIVTLILIAITLYTLNITIRDIIDFFKTKKSPTLKTLVKNANKSDSVLEKRFNETKNMLSVMNKSYLLDLYTTMTIIMFVTSIIIALTFNNLFLVIPLTLGLCTIPFWTLLLFYYSYKKNISGDLYVTLNMLTNSYERTDNIVFSVEENIANIPYNLKPYFEQFLLESRFVNSSIKESLEHLKNKINNNLFYEWVNIVISCQDDITNKATLRNVLDKLQETKNLKEELNADMFSPLIEFLLTLLIVVSVLAGCIMFNEQVSTILFYSTIGKFLISLFILTIVFTTEKVVRLTKPIDYR